MRILNLLSYLSLLVILFSACSDLKQPLQSNLDAEINPHPAGFLNRNSSDFHAAFLRTIGWDLSNCQQCHGTDYSGGIAEISCLSCHRPTPEDCIVCHGGVEDLTGAPPLDLDDNQAISARGVGSHTAHLIGGKFALGIACQECHQVPSTFAAPGHVDSDLPAEVIFGSLASLNGAAPVWNQSSLTCSESYCHGNWSLSKAESNFPDLYAQDNLAGNAAQPTWTDPTTVACGSCHNLPPTGHKPYALTQCSICHTLTVDDQGNILNKSKHINGKVNVFQQEYPMF